jgi:hypothetical protein
VRSILLLGFLILGFAPQQAGQPINAMCPVKPKLKSRATITLVYEGQIIGFC